MIVAIKDSKLPKCTKHAVFSIPTDYQTHWIDSVIIAATRMIRIVTRTHTHTHTHITYILLALWTFVHWKKCSVKFNRKSVLLWVFCTFFLQNTHRKVRFSAKFNRSCFLYSQVLYAIEPLGGPSRGFLILLHYLLDSVSISRDWVYYIPLN